MGAVAIEPSVRPTKLNKRTVKEGVATAVRISRQVFDSTRQKSVLVTLALILLLVASCIGVVVGAYQSRELFNELSELQAERNYYQGVWSQLLLEQSALGAYGRVEALAAKNLNMVVPGRDDIVLVPVTSSRVAR